MLNKISWLIFSQKKKKVDWFFAKSTIEKKRKKEKHNES